MEGAPEISDQELKGAIASARAAIARAQETCEAVREMRWHRQTQLERSRGPFRTAREAETRSRPI